MIITKLQGGLGNQLFQYAIGRRFAIDRQTELKIDIDFFDNQENVTPRNFKLDVFNIEASLASKADKLKVLGNPLFQLIKRRYWKMGLDLFRWNYIRESSYIFHPEVLEVENAVYLDGYWQCPLYFDSIRLQLLNEILPKKEFETDKFLNKSKEIKNTNSIAIHIRRGDYVLNPVVSEQFGVCSVEYYTDAIEYISAKVENASFYVFSDDISWCKENLKNERVNIEYVSNFADYEDLMLISRCKHQIISNSTFSWWGAWLNQNPEKIVVAPNVWYKDPNLDTSQLIPKEWKRI
jgi:hypothetical protein